MARPKKQEASSSELVQELEVRKKQLEILYKKLAVIKDNVDTALTYLGRIDSCETLAEAAFRAGGAYRPLDKADDDLEEMLDELYNSSDCEHWTDITNN